MNIRTKLTAAAVFSLAVGAATVAAKDTVPNIVYILADDLGIGDVRAYNAGGKIATPNIDRLVREGMKFTDAHTNSSVCTPTRYGILTGRYAWRTRLKQAVLQGHSPHLIDPERVTVASLLKSRGYATAAFGKWHLGMDWSSTDGGEVRSSRPENLDTRAPVKNGPLDVGFDYYFGIAGSLNMDPHAFMENRLLIGTLEFVRDQKALPAGRIAPDSKPGWVAREYRQDAVLATLAEKTRAWIRGQVRNSGGREPFFVYMPLPAPHAPIVPSDRFKGHSGLSEYADYCMETDWVVGEVLAEVDELGVADNTIVIFTSDNGASPRAQFKFHQEHGHFPSWIYRGLKGTTWEGGHRVPFAVRWPDKVEAGSECQQPICTTDLLATCADLLGVTLSDNAGEDSVSFLPALEGRRIPGGSERLIVHHSDHGIFAVRKGRWKLMLDNKGGSRRRNPKDKPVIDADEFLLFDMESDPIASRNLSRKHPEVVLELKRDLAEIVRRGRSTPGAPQPYVGSEPDADWPQLEPIRDFLR